MKDVIKLSTQNELLDYLKTREQINFIALCASNFQAIGIDVIIEILKEEGIQLNGVVLMLTDEYLSFQFSCHNANIDYIEYKNQLDKNINYYRLSILKYLCYYKKKDFYFISINISYTWYTFLNLYSKKARLNWIITEDGVGNYLKKGMEKTYLYNKLCGGYLRTWFLGLIKRSLLMLQYSITPTREITLLNKNNRMKINNSVKELYCREIKKRHQALKGLKNIEDTVSDKVIFLIEFSRIDADTKMAEYQLIKDMCDYFKLRRVDYFIKPHPRERNIEVYEELGNVFESSNSISLEMLLGNTEPLPRAVIGTVSTCLYVANSLYGIKTISLGRIFLNNKGFKNLGMRSTIKEFIRKFEKTVIFPESVSEVYSLI